MKKTWTEKLNAPARHQVKPVPIDIAGMKKGEIMLVPTPHMIDAFIRAIPPGASMDVRTLRHKLARRFKAEVACPITTGFHLRTVAEAACEALQQGAAMDTITPFWRVLDADTPTTRKLACGPGFVTAQRTKEGI
ncbi:hypothetical protein FHP25_03710 [Vineibacter terrae]|uniref:Uncharacterized protein n=1 Tax=Vineibacter terrae TaxID=2586908 RepID=A0A5C8PTV6_9HYPH|nr:hypothetical protein [Vineibacter terrae]TXL81646.1 hypothetical protein FHP25_03710 [Vineibacter terrae]